MHNQHFRNLNRLADTTPGNGGTNIGCLNCHAGGEDSSIHGGDSVVPTTLNGGNPATMPTTAMFLNGGGLAVWTGTVNPAGNTTLKCAGTNPSDQNWGGGNINTSATQTAMGLGCNHHTTPSGATGTTSPDWIGLPHDPGVTTIWNGTTYKPTAVY